MSEVRGRLRHALWLLLSFVAGAAVMNGEIAAGRLLAPSLGTSTTTWALLIGTVLASLSLGNLAGGYLSGRGDAARWVTRLLLAAAALFALLPRAVPWLLAGSLARFREHGVLSLALTAGASALLVALPMGALGAIPPLLLQAAEADRSAEEPTAVGALSGKLSAAGTLGSLLGTFGAALVFLPWLGTRRTFDLAVAMLLTVSLGLALRSKHKPAVASATLVSLVLVVTCVLPPRLFEPLQPGLVWSEESLYNHIRVVEQRGERQLRLNDGYAVQSFVRLDGQLPLRDVWAYYALAPSWGKSEAPRKVLLLGLGGGTSARAYHELYPAAELVGVELDGAVVATGRRFFGLDATGARVIIGDARAFVSAECPPVPQGYDVVVLDAFQFPYVPFHLATRELFTAVRSCLAPGGVLMVNVGRDGEARGVVHAVTKTLSEVFPHVASADPPNRSNTIVVATTHPLEEARGVRGLVVPPAALATLERLAATYAPMKPAIWPAETNALTDDLAPVEHLTDRIIWRARLSSPSSPHLPRRASPPRARCPGAR